jgi:hypothetical protein
VSTLSDFNEFSLVIDSFGADGTRPVAAAGVSVTPGNNAYGGYVSLIAGASVTDDAYGILINVNSIGANTFARDTLVTIGLDSSGGSSFTDWITDLIVSCAAPYAGSTFSIGVEYYFPLLVKAGASIGIKGTQNNAAPAAFNSFVRLFCQPSRPDLLKVGSGVRTYGSTPASSSGTALTQGTTSDGAYVDVGTIAAGDNPWFWQVGLGVNNAAIGASAISYVDMAIGQAGAKRNVIRNQRVGFNSNEQLIMSTPIDGYGVGAAGEHVYVRAQHSAAAVTGVSGVAYGVVG